MKNKFQKLSVVSFVIALSIFVFSYILYHYTLPSGGFTTVFQAEPGKPLVTLLFSIWGVMFLFSGVTNLLIANIFFKDTK